MPVQPVNMLVQLPLVPALDKPGKGLTQSPSDSMRAKQVNPITVLY
jgi:hypothetical protein